MNRITILESKLKKTKPESTARIDILNDLVYEIATPYPERAKKLADEAYKLSQKLKYKKGLAHADRNQGMISFFKPDPEKARDFLLSALDKYKKIGHKAGEADALFYLGLIYWGFGDITKGFEYTSSSLKLSRESGHSLGEAWALNMLGGYYYDLQVYPQSLEHFQKAYPMFEKLHAIKGEARSLNGIGNNYHKMGDSQKALRYQHRSLKILQAYKIEQIESRVLNDIAGILQAFGNYEDAFEHYERSLSLRRKIGHTTGETTTLLDLGNLLVLQKENDKALEVFAQALQLAEQINAKPKICKAYQGLSQVYGQQDQYKKALEFYKKFHEMEREVYQDDFDKKLQNMKAIHDLETSQKMAEIHRLRNVELKGKNERLASLLNELKTTQIQLVHAEKMASLGKLVAGIAHEINNPIGAISSTNNVNSICIKRVEKGIEDSNSPAELADSQQFQKAIAILKSNIGVISKGADRINTLIKNLKNFSQLDEAEFQKVDIHEGIESVLLLIKNKLRDQIEIVKKYDEIPEIYCYPSQLNQVFMNLLTNAIQAIETKGTISIETSQADDCVHVCISDTGRGIPKQELNTLFEFDFSNSSSRIKMGSGLVIAYTIIQRHKGHIKVDSTVGKGSTFIVTLPTNLHKNRENAE